MQAIQSLLKMVNDDITTLRQKRGVLKQMVTKMEKLFSSHARNASLAELEVKLRQLRKYESQFDGIQDELESTDPAEFETEERSEFEDRIGNIEALLLNLKGELSGNLTLNESSAGTNITILDSSVSDLPKLDLPKFSGEYLDFPQFIDTFNTLVHNHTGRGMNDLRRFALLKSCLEARPWIPLRTCL